MIYIYFLRVIFQCRFTRILLTRTFYGSEKNTKTRILFRITDIDILILYVCITYIHIAYVQNLNFELKVNFLKVKDNYETFTIIIFFFSFFV